MNKNRVEKLGESIADLSKSYKLSKDALTNLASGMEQLRRAIIDERELNSDNENLKNEIAKLKQHLKSKENLYENEEIPFADEQYEEDLLAELQDRHQQDCIEINRLNTVIEVLIDKYSRLRQQIGL